MNLTNSNILPKNFHRKFDNKNMMYSVGHNFLYLVYITLDPWCLGHSNNSVAPWETQHDHSGELSSSGTLPQQNK